VRLVFGRILSLTFRPQEAPHGYVVVLRQMLEAYGAPWTLYGDRANMLVRNDRRWSLEEEFAGRQRPSHFGQMLEDLGIRYIAALSPQAKGRIERLWRTLQDRLAAELALAVVAAREAAEAFLPDFIERFTRRFGQPPRLTLSAWRKPPRELDRILACRYLRTVTLDHMVSIPGATISIPPGPQGRSYARCRVEVRELMDGRLLVLYEDRPICQQPPPSTSFTLVPRDNARAERRPRRDRDHRTVAPPRAPKPAPPRATPDQKLLARRGRKPVQSHIWKKGFDPNLLRKAAGAKGVS
jgi:hypothetical protein